MMARRSNVGQPDAQAADNYEIAIAFRVLKRAAELARRLTFPPSEFAVGLQELQCAGASGNTLRLLLLGGLVEHLIELTSRRSSDRTFSPCRNLRFVTDSCFVLSAVGVKAVGKSDRH